MNLRYTRTGHAKNAKNAKGMPIPNVWHFLFYYFLEHPQLPNFKYSKHIFTCSQLKRVPWRLHVGRPSYSCFFNDQLNVSILWQVFSQHKDLCLFVMQLSQMAFQTSTIGAHGVWHLDLLSWIPLCTTYSFKKCGLKEKLWKQNWSYKNSWMTFLPKFCIYMPSENLRGTRIALELPNQCNGTTRLQIVVCQQTICFDSSMDRCKAFGTNWALYWEGGWSRSGVEFLEFLCSGCIHCESNLSLL